ncbi:hypothetical protein SAMN04489724_0637 [Algoriphagus locisalis]|uniref:Uncharacterized protein n=1 Tax=Algoriphagus locisalis TaxID=305507 RepID=A0A1I6XS15_9BACT|nr:hypothetical protein SAMN04489724_0637 [Algoriphagus locisalis]
MIYKIILYLCTKINNNANPLLESRTKKASVSYGAKVSLPA